MSKKCKIGVVACIAALIIVIVLLAGLFLSWGGVFKPSLSVIGGDQRIELNSQYIEAGAKGRRFFQDVSDEIQISGTVDTQQLGEAVITYQLGNTIKTRMVEVVDTTAPQIALIGEAEMHIFEKETYQEPGVEISDASCVDGQSLLSIEGAVDTQMPGEYELVYTARDASGNEASISRKVIVEKDPALIKLHYGYDFVDNTAFEWWFNKSQDHQRMAGAIDEAILKQYDAYYLGADEKVIYLTFDEGGNDITYIKEIAEVLNAHDVPATFFLTRNYVLDNAEFMRELDRAGHLIGNHTRHHYEMPTLANETDVDQFVLEFLECDKAIWLVIGHEPEKVFRFPKGATSERAMKMVSDLGYRTYFWSHAYFDYGADVSKEEALKTLVDHLHNGAIYLLHPSNKGYYLAMEEFIAEAQRQGYSFALVSEIHS